jgi:predicted HD phosphohydrolase
MIPPPASMPEAARRWLKLLERQVCGLPVNQLVHSLQTATRAVRANASDELVLCALLHDLTKAYAWRDHGRTTAQLLKPYISEDSYWVILTHMDFHGLHFYARMGKDPNQRLRYKDRPWYDTASRFADEWDHRSFNPKYPNLPLAHFDPLLDRFLSAPRPDFHMEPDTGFPFFLKLRAELVARPARPAAPPAVAK